LGCGGEVVEENAAGSAVFGAGGEVEVVVAGLFHCWIVDVDGATATATTVVCVT